MDFVTNINWATPSWDLFIILFFVVAAFLYGLSLGRNRVIVILISIYMALAIVNTAPYLNSFTTEVSYNSASVFKVSIFVGLFIVLFFLLSRGALLKTIASSDNSGSWWQSILFSFFHVGLILSILLYYIPREIIEKYLSPGMSNTFISDPARFFWLVAPIVMMVLIRKRKSDD